MGHTFDKATEGTTVGATDTHRASITVDKSKERLALSDLNKSLAQIQNGTLLLRIGGSYDPELIKIIQTNLGMASQNGIYDQATAEAVKTFQSSEKGFINKPDGTKVNLRVDSILGPRTFCALFGDNSEFLTKYKLSKISATNFAKIIKNDWQEDSVSPPTEGSESTVSVSGDFSRLGIEIDSTGKVINILNKDIANSLSLEEGVVIKKVAFGDDKLSSIDEGDFAKMAEKLSAQPEGELKVSIVIRDLSGVEKTVVSTLSPHSSESTPTPDSPPKHDSDKKDEKQDEKLDAKKCNIKNILGEWTETFREMLGSPDILRFPQCFKFDPRNIDIGITWRPSVEGCPPVPSDGGLGVVIRSESSLMNSMKEINGDKEEDFNGGNGCAGFVLYQFGDVRCKEMGDNRVYEPGPADDHRCAKLANEMKNSLEKFLNDPHKDKFPVYMVENSPWLRKLNPRIGYLSKDVVKKYLGYSK